MKTPLTEIVFILYRSGSMQSMVEPAISGFNRLLREQQQIPGNAQFTLVLFDDHYELPVNAVPIAEVVELDMLISEDPIEDSFILCFKPVYPRAFTGAGRLGRNRLNFESAGFGHFG